MIELEKMRTLTMENPRNLGIHQIIKISLVLYNAHLVSRDQNKFVFYVNNYINWDWFNKLYDSDWIKKDIRNIDAVARKLRLASTTAINNTLEAAKEERQKREEIMERQKVEAMAAK